MPRPSKRARTVAAAALTALLAAAVASCGSGTHAAAPHADRALQQCRDQWRDVGDTVAGMDQDPDPSALADRWTSVIATVDYYRTADTVKHCQEAVDAQVKAVTALHQFSDRLRPYDMAYQLGQVRAAIDLYLNDPLPAPVRDGKGKRVAPPKKPAVRAALQALSDNAAQANAELEPGWTQTASVDLTDQAAVDKTVHDLEFLARDSPHWLACEQALRVLVAAVGAQEGLAASPSATPSAGPTDATSP